MTTDVWEALSKARVAWDTLTMALCAIGFERAVVDFAATYQRGRVTVKNDPCGAGVYVDDTYIGGIDDITGLVDLLVEHFFVTSI